MHAHDADELSEADKPNRFNKRLAWILNWEQHRNKWSHNQWKRGFAGWLFFSLSGGVSAFLNAEMEETPFQLNPVLKNTNTWWNMMKNGHSHSKHLEIPKNYSRLCYF